MIFKMYGDYIISCFFAALSVAMFILSFQLPKSKVMTIGPDFMPMVISVIMFILSVILFVVALSERRIRAAEIERSGYKDNSDYKRVILSFLLILAYTYVLAPVGFTISSIVFLPAEMYVLAPGENRTMRELLKYIVISVVLVFVVYFLFRYGFKILLPTGIFAIEF